MIDASWTTIRLTTQLTTTSALCGRPGMRSRGATGQRPAAIFWRPKAEDALRSDDLYALAEADWWLGLIQEALAAYEESYHRYLSEDRRERAAMSAMELAGTLFLAAT